jgi:Domain of unknown function (DUF4287)/Domain of unknown function (DUF5655)
MSFQAYLDNIKATTGKTPDDFRKLAAKKGLVRAGEIVAWLKADFALGHGHASAIAHLLVHGVEPSAKSNDKLALHFAGTKEKWRKSCDALAVKLTNLGSDVALNPNRSYINLNRGSKKFGIVQISAADRIDVGIKLKGVPAAGRLEAAGAWNAMVTHRVRIEDPKQLNAELIGWLKQAYEAAA